MEGKEGRTPLAPLQPCQQGVGPLPGRAVGPGWPWQGPPPSAPAARKASRGAKGEVRVGRTGAGEPLGRPVGAASWGGRGVPRAVRWVGGERELRVVVLRRPAARPWGL